ncbi:MAG: four helix bundle protein [Candidatus Yanofskybacteria bacterium]|nr:four helix bundle protein [Candidatus Yanofskybacteria bacterium]
MEHPPPKNIRTDRISGTAAKLLAAYVQWHSITRHIPKMRRYSLGIRIDALFAELVELIAAAQFAPSLERPPLLARAIARNDVLKFMLTALWELEGIGETRFSDLSARLEEIGRMLYGWKHQAGRHTGA